MSYSPVGYSQTNIDKRARKIPNPPKFLKPLLKQKVTQVESSSPSQIIYDYNRAQNPYQRHPHPSSPESHDTITSPTENNIKQRNRTLPPGLLAAMSTHQKRASSSSTRQPSPPMSSSQKRLESLTGGGLTTYLQSVEKRPNNRDNDDATSLFSTSMIIDVPTNGLNAGLNGGSKGGSKGGSGFMNKSHSSISFPTSGNDRMRSLRLASKSLLLEPKSSSRHKLHAIPPNLLARKYAITEKTKFTLLSSPVKEANQRRASSGTSTGTGKHSHSPRSKSPPTTTSATSPTSMKTKTKNKSQQPSIQSPPPQQWANNYVKDTEFFTSRALWTEMKLAEAASLDRGTLSPYPGNFLSGVVGHLLIAEETVMARNNATTTIGDLSMPQLMRTVVDHVLQAEYSESSKLKQVCLNFRSNGHEHMHHANASIHGDAIAPAFPSVAHFRASKHASPTVRSPTPSAMRMKKAAVKSETMRAELIEHLLPIHTFSRLAHLLREAKEHETSLLPQFEEALAILNVQRAQEIRTMASTVKRYQLKQIAKIFRTWHRQAKASKRAVEMLTTWLRDSHLITARQAFDEWRHVATTFKHHREIEFEKSARAQMDRYMSKLGFLRKKTMSHMQQLEPVMRAGDQLEKQIAPLLKILHDPARQPPILLIMLKGIYQAINIVGTTLMTQQENNGREEHRRGRYTARMSYIFPKIPIRTTVPMGGKGKEEFAPPVCHVDEPPVDAIDGAILKWTPGQLTNDEYTPAFEPFNTSTGKRLKRWANHILETEYQNRARVDGYVTNSLKIGNNPEDDLEDGSIFAVLHRSTPNLSMTCSQDPPSLTEIFDLDKVTRAKRVIREMTKYVQPNMCRHVTSELMTGIKDPPTPEEMAKHEKRMARLAAREKESGIIVHVMSRYMGMRIHIHDTKERVKFSLIAELLSRYQGGALYTPPELEKRTYKHLSEAAEHWKECNNKLLDLITKQPIKHTDQYMLDLSKELKMKFNRSIEIYTWTANCMHSTLDDRDEWMRWREEVTFVCWQSMCTTVLSRKVKIEEDVDDGSFTTIDPLQLMNSVFKRLKIHEDPIEQDRCIAGIIEYCKSRIRDFKRIFQYYAAAEEGNANSMDHCEYWKWVRECKLQKDRKCMPSVRVDLEFQAANMDYTKTGSDRLASDDGELESVEWIEVITRLASFRYPKKPKLLDERYIKMMQEEVLENACSVDIDVFRERLAGDKVQACLKQNKRNLKGIYTIYAADDQSDDAVAQGDTMNNKELCSFCKEMKLLGPILSNRMVRQIFAFVQQEEEELDEDEGEDDEGGDNEMVYSEYAEAISAIACVLKPNPYCTVDTRLRDYLRYILFPAAKKNEKTRKVIKGKF